MISSRQYRDRWRRCGIRLHTGQQSFLDDNIPVITLPGRFSDESQWWMLSRGNSETASGFSGTVPAVRCGNTGQLAVFRGI